MYLEDGPEFEEQIHRVDVKIKLLLDQGIISVQSLPFNFIESPLIAFCVRIIDWRECRVSLSANL